MNVKGDPYKPRVTKGVYSKKKTTTYYHRRGPIENYDEKVAKEKARWKEIYKRTKDKLIAATLKRYAENPEMMKEKARDMREKGGNAARAETTRRRTELMNLARECNCYFPVTTTWENQDKAIAYFKKLKEVRDKMEAERERSL